MKFVVTFLLAWVLALLWSVAESSRKVTCSFEPDHDDDDITVKLLAGPPGLQGQKGSRVEKGDNGQTCENKEIKQELQRKVSALESRLENDAALNAFKRKDCTDVAKEGFNVSGIYNIWLDGKIVQVYCDFHVDGGSWLVFQRRESGVVDFYLDWSAYKTGFGEKSGEFWLGLENLHAITSSDSYKLRVDLEDWDGNTAYAEYSTVTVGDSSTEYSLNIGSYNGTAGDSMTAKANNRRFSTKDNDNHLAGFNCASKYDGAWWYNKCFDSNLNGEYIDGGGSKDYIGILWYHWKGWYVSLKKTEMKLQRI